MEDHLAVKPLSVIERLHALRLGEKDTDNIIPSNNQQ